jgi:hypothetical protein
LWWPHLALWHGDYWLGLNNGGLALASFLRHVDALPFVSLLDLEPTSSRLPLSDSVVWRMVSLDF